ncbi:MAG: HipA domain-containing protein [Sphaerochaeta sp.]|jgi:serine/threonine-protein kinase HipA|nr:HipA domain-containing protein [Sphaerochaeta sp.]
MNQCLYCRKPLTQDENHWHTACIKKFFGISELPVLAIDTSELEKYARTAIDAGLTVPGVQKKLSLHLDRTQGRWRLTLIGYPPGFIAKLQTEEYAHLPELEDATMHMADAASILTVPHSLIPLHDGSLAYISKRIDRVTIDQEMHKLPMEDFCQLSSRLTEDKYKGSYEQCGKLINTYSSQSMLDITNFWYLLVFCFITGNSDMHLKNFSLYAPDGRHYQLTPAYDLLPATLVLPEDKEETALSLGGKRSRLNRLDFLQLAQHLNLAPKVGERLLHRLLALEDVFIDIINASHLTEEEKQAFEALIRSRMRRLQA